MTGNGDSGSTLPPATEKTKNMYYLISMFWVIIWTIKRWGLFQARWSIKVTCVEENQKWRTCQFCSILFQFTPSGFDSSSYRPSLHTNNRNRCLMQQELCCKRTILTWGFLFSYCIFFLGNKRLFKIVVSRVSLGNTSWALKSKKNEFHTLLFSFK